ncbi:MAG: hypothetical protein KGS61_00970 [Verrucomicrobia bacterium]|nr:hypothetical protein [Verrucomicrobiota bacterium]
MNRESITAHLEAHTWKSFRGAVAAVMAEDENSTSVMAGMYSQVRLGKIFPTRKENLIYSLIVLITPLWLLLVKWLVAPWAYPKRARELRLSRAADFGPEANHPEIVIVLAAALPSLYDSFMRLLNRLDQGEASVAAVIFPPVLKHKRPDLQALRCCVRLSLYDELVQLPARELFAAARRARRQYREVVARVTDAQLRAFFILNRRLIRLLFLFDDLYEAGYRRMFSIVRPRLVVDNWFNGALRKVTRELGIYTVMLQHGTQWGDDKEGVTQDEDELITWGEYWQANFRKAVFPHVSLRPLGCPRFDAVIEARQKPRDPRFYAAMKIDPQCWTVTFLSQAHGFRFPEKARLAYQEVITALSELVAVRRHELNFIIKLHPHDDRAYFEAVLPPASRGEVRFLKHEVPLYDLFRHSDVAITVNSTAILEAIAMDLPAIQYACEQVPDWLDFCTDGGGFLVRSGADLVSVIDELRANAGFREAAQRQRRAYVARCLANLGQATEKVADHLLAVAARLKARG